MFFETLLRKALTWKRIAELPSPNKEAADRMYRTLIKIEVYWWGYPLVGGAIAALAMFVWIIVSGSSPLLGPSSPWMEGFAFATFFFFAGKIITRILFLDNCKKQLQELRSLFATSEGERAGKLLDDLDRSVLWIARRAASRTLLCWIW